MNTSPVKCNVSEESLSNTEKSKENIRKPKKNTPSPPSLLAKPKTKIRASLKITQGYKAKARHRPIKTKIKTKPEIKEELDSNKNKTIKPSQHKPTQIKNYTTLARPRTKPKQ